MTEEIKENWASGSFIMPNKQEDSLSVLDDENVNSEKWREKYLSKNITSCSWELILNELGHGGHTNIFQLDEVFSKSYCKELIEQAEASNKWTKKRHDNYPTTDMLLSAFGANLAYENILRKFIYPMIIDRWRLEGDKWNNLVGENFIIKYEDEGQAALELHHDNSEFTCLTALNEDFEGGGTWFHNQKLLVKNPVGGLTFHPGSITHLHGGRPTTSGIRYIIVSFCRCND